MHIYLPREKSDGARLCERCAEPNLGASGDEPPVSAVIDVMSAAFFC